MMLKFANAALLEAKIASSGDGLMRTAHRAVFDYQPRPGFLYVRSRAISSRTNDNFDTFPAEEIEAGWMTFVGKPVFVNHHNDDHRRARGVIIDAALHKDTALDGSPDTWVEVLMEVDAVRFPKLAQAILEGDIERTSMGCDVAYSLCSFCGNKATTPVEYCAHIPRLKGKRIRRVTAGSQPEDVLVHEICHGLGFFENSLLVEPPADPTAYFLGVDDRGLKMSASRKTAAVKTYVVMDTGDGGAGGTAYDMHIAGCGDIYSPKYHGGSPIEVSGESWQEGLSDFIDPQMEDQGWSKSDVRVLPCAKSGVPVEAKPLAEGQCPSSGTFLDNPRRMHSLPCPGCGKRVKMNFVSGKVPRHKPYIAPKTAGKRVDIMRQGDSAEVYISDDGGAELTYVGRLVPPGGSNPAMLYLEQPQRSIAVPAAVWKGGKKSVSEWIAGRFGKTALMDDFGEYGYWYTKGEQAQLDGLGAEFDYDWAHDLSDRDADSAKDAWFRGYQAGERFSSPTYASKTAKDDKDHGNTDKGNTTDRGYGWKHQKKREELLKNDPKCHWCHDAKATEADHTTGGKLVPSCAPCNNERSHEQQKRSKLAGMNDQVWVAKPIGEGLDAGWVSVGGPYQSWDYETQSEHADMALAQRDLAANPGSELVDEEVWASMHPRFAKRAATTPWTPEQLAEDWPPKGWDDQWLHGDDDDDFYGDDDEIEVEGSQKLAYGEVKAPAQIDTLRIRQCEVCNEEDSWDGDGRCRVCGYLPAPEPFRSPDLDVAQKADLREGPVNPDLFKAPAFVPPEDKADDKPKDDKPEKTPESAASGADPLANFRSSRNPVHATMDPSKDQNAEGAVMRPSLAAFHAQENIIAAQAARIAELTRQADTENPAQPVPEDGQQGAAQSTDQARAADTTTDVTTPGGVMPAPSAMTTTEPTTPGGVAEAPAAIDQTVTAPVSGTTDQRPLGETKTEITPETGGEAIGPNYIGGDWANTATAKIASAVQAHTFAALRLARLRIEAGLANGDDLVLGQRIAADMELPAIRAEIGTLSNVIKANASRRTASTGAGAGRRQAPSLVSTASPVQRFASRPSMDPTDDEFLFV